VSTLDKRVIISFFIAMLLLTVFYYQVPAFIKYHNFQLKEWLYYVLFTGFVPFGFLLLRSNPIDGFIGELSYPIYISHYILIGVVGKFFRLQGGTWNMFIMTSVVTIIVSLILVQLIDKPIDRYRQKRLQT